MRVVRSGDPIKALREAVDNSLMGRLLGFGEEGLSSAQDRIPQYDPNRSVYDVDPVGLPSTFDSFMSNFTPFGDLESVAMAISDLGDGNYVQAALLPLMMVLPPAMGKQLRKHVDDLRRVKMSSAPDFDKRQEVVRIMGDMDKLNKEALQFRSTNPQAYDQAMMEVAQSSESISDLATHRALSDDLAADVFVSGRQRELGYRGDIPSPIRAGLEYKSRDPLGGPPINTGDKRGLDLVEGTPSERAVASALLHQSHGSAGKTGLVGSAEMQRLKGETPLTRTPIPGQQYRVIRDGDEMLLKAGEIEEGDIIRSLSQTSQGTYGGSDRIVSTSAQDVADNYAAFHHNVHEGGGPASDILAEIELKEKTLGPDPTQMEVDAYIDELLQGSGGLGIGGLADPNRPSFKIINTKGMPVTRADMMKPGSGPGSLLYKGEDEFGVSARQAFDVLQTGLEQEGIPFMLLSPNRRFKYKHGGKFRILKR